MLYMVIERFRDGQAGAVHDRFLNKGRMMPARLIYHGSWIERETTRCFQLMEAESPEDFAKWTAEWSDLVEFEIVPVVESGQFWAEFARGKGAGPVEL